LAWLGLPISSHHNQLQQAGNVVRDAAAAAIEAGELHTAVEWLEQGRSVIWGQLVQLRSPLDDLKDIRPDLADQLIQICKDLDSAGTSEGFTSVGVGSDQRSAELIAQWCHSLAIEREELLKHIQTLEGFDRFLLPKAISELTLAAHAGPVVILNASKFRCDALVISQQSDLVLVPLTGFTYNNAQELHKSLKGLLHNHGRLSSISDRAGRLAPVNQQDELERQFQHILSVLWMHVVKPVLDVLDLMVCLYFLLYSICLK
jgi:hypothetical protein